MEMRVQFLDVLIIALHNIKHSQASPASAHKIISCVILGNILYSVPIVHGFRIVSWFVLVVPMGSEVRFIFERHLAYPALVRNYVSSAAAACGVFALCWSR